MKKIVAFVLILAMVFSLAACGNNDSSEGAYSSASSKTEDTSSSSESALQTEGTSSSSESALQTEGTSSSSESALQTEGTSSSSESALQTEGTSSSSESALQTEESSAPETENPSNAIIVYFSWSGNTEAVANEIQTQTGADIFEITPAEPYTDNYDELLDIAQEEQASGARPAIAETVEDFAQYDIVYFGFPNWWGDMPMILYTFLDDYDFSGKTIAPFVTSGGSGFSSTISTIESQEPNATVVDGLSLDGSGAANPDEEVMEWLSSVGLAG